MFETNNEGVIGFSYEMKKLFRGIALQLREFNLADLYCDDLYKKVRIDPSMYYILPLIQNS